jgi:uncharacterized protein YuzE
MRMSHYARESDIASLTLGERRGNLRAEETEWGLLEYDADTGALVGAELWDASTRLPRELLDALPEPVGPEVVVERQPA